MKSYSGALLYFILLVYANILKIVAGVVQQYYILAQNRRLRVLESKKKFKKLKLTTFYLHITYHNDII